MLFQENVERNIAIKEKKRQQMEKDKAIRTRMLCTLAP